MNNSTKKSGHPILSQLISFVPRDLIDASVSEFDSDKYYKTMTTFKQFTFLFYGVVSRAPSLNSLCKNLSFCQDSLARLGIDRLLPVPYLMPMLKETVMCSVNYISCF